MANDLNQCNFIGRLGKDPETRFLPSGDAVANFSLAVGWKGKDKEGTEWVNVSAFGKLGEIVGEFCQKGKQVFVSGRFTTIKYQDKDGADRYSTKIVADKVQLLGSKPEGQQAGQQEPKPERKTENTASRPATKSSGTFDEMDDGIPFLFNISTILHDTLGHSKSLLRAKHGKTLSILQVNQIEF